MCRLPRARICPSVSPGEPYCHAERPREFPPSASFRSTDSARCSVANGTRVPRTRSPLAALLWRFRARSRLDRALAQNLRSNPPSAENGNSPGARGAALVGSKTQINMAKSEEVIRKHKEYLWPAVANFYQHPLVADRAHMQYVLDFEGRKSLDFFGGIL